MAREWKDPISRLVFELSKLPGIGEKSATRLAYHLLKQEGDTIQSLVSAIDHAKQATVLCTFCYNFTDTSPCAICSDTNRDQTQICVVEQPSDVTAIERAAGYRGVYHVLHGTLSPLDGVGPDELKIKELLCRLNDETVEVVIATNPSVEGEATSLYLSKLIKTLGLKVSRLAHGLPVGAILEYTDRETISKALECRVLV